MFAILLVYTICRKQMQNDEERDDMRRERREAEGNENQTVAEVANEEAPVKRRYRFCARFNRSQPLALFLATFFFIFMKLPQFMSMFWFTQNEAEVALAFFVFGSLVGSQNFSFLIMNFAKDYYRPT